MQDWANDKPRQHVASLTAATEPSLVVMLQTVCTWSCIVLVLNANKHVRRINRSKWTHLDVVDELGAEGRVPVELIPQSLRRALLNQVDRLRVWICWEWTRGERSMFESRGSPLKRRLSGGTHSCFF